jgi:serine/threonine-protein kinase
LNFSYMVERRRAYEIFVAALDKTDVDRTAFVADACGGDRLLREEVEALLRAAEGDSMPTSALLGGAAEEQESEVGEVFGNFRLSERIGIGGMGVVYRAERVDGVPQSVAVKLLLGEVTGPDLARFQREAQMLARLEHPAVARLIDTGVQHGRTWIALEYVRGTRIDIFCDDRKVPTRQRVQLLLQLTDAVAAAHRMLVVHRDIKPANVLVTDQGFPKLIDFGIGATLSPVDADPAPTLNLARLFTPNYSSPEQVSGGAVTVATDIFGLGALGYRLLGGCPPFPDAKEPLRYILAVTHDDVDAPSAAAQRAGHDPRLVRELRGDLDAILLKALARDPARRYATANDLAADLRRYLANEPVLARNPSFAYRLQRFVRRHRIPVGAAALLLCGAIAAAAVYVKQAHAVSLARDMAAQRDRFLETLLTSANPSIGRRDVMVADLLDKVIRQSDADISPDPLVAASILGVVGRTEKGLGRYEQAQLANDRQLALVRRHGGDKDQLIDALNLRSLLLFMRGRPAEAEAPTRETLNLLDYHCDADGAYVDTLDILGEIQGAQQHDDDADASYRSELACVERFRGPKWNVRTVHTLNNIMVLNKNRGRSVAALATGREAVELAKTAFPADAPYRLTTELNFADTLASAGRAVEAEPQIRDVMARRLSVLGPDQPETLMTGIVLANDLLLQRRFSEAAATARAAAISLDLVVGPEHPLAASAWAAYGNAICHAGQAEAGLEALRRAEAARAQRFTAAGWQTLTTRAAIGSCLLAQRRFAAAEPELLAAAAGLEAAGRARYFVTQAAYADLRDLHAAIGDAPGAALWSDKIAPSAASGSPASR